mgnify:CR=1 FL=1
MKVLREMNGSLRGRAIHKYSKKSNQGKEKRLGTAALDQLNELFYTRLRFDFTDAIFQQKCDLLIVLIEHKVSLSM